MATIVTEFDSDGTYTVPANVPTGFVVIDMAGASGSYNADAGFGAFIYANLPCSAGDTISAYAGDYHLGAGGAGVEGGGSSAVELNGVLQFEAGGGGGSGTSSNATTLPPSVGGNGGNPGTPGASSGGGAANGATPGAAGLGNLANGTAGTVGGVAGSVNGGPPATTTGASSGGGGGGYAGGGSGGLVTDGTNNAGHGGGPGSNYVAPGISFWQITTDSAPGLGYVKITVTVSDPPQLPTLISPANSLQDELSTPGPTFNFAYNKNTDTSAMNGWAFRRKVSGGAYAYWTATGSLGAPGGNWTSTTPVWNSIGYLVQNGDGTWSYTFPTGVWSDGLTTYNWSVNTQESAFDLQSGFATDFTVIGQVAPILVVTALPTEIPSSTPVISWGATFPSGASQITYRVVYYTEAQTTAPGFIAGASPSTYDTGVVASANASLTTPTAAQLANDTEYVIYVQITQTGGSVSPWESCFTTIVINGPAVPLLSVVASNDDVTNAPFVALTALNNNNQLSAVDSSFETGIGHWDDGNFGTCTLARFRLSPSSLDGDYCLRLTSTVSTEMSSTSGLATYAVNASQGYSAMAFLRAATTPHNCFLSLTWYDAFNVQISQVSGTVEADTTTGWTRITVSGTAPTNAATVRVGIAVVVSAVGEQHYVDCVGLFSGLAVPVWSLGGFYEDANLTNEFQYSDDGGVTWNDLRFGAAEPINTAQTATCLDYECPPVLEVTPNGF